MSISLILVTTQRKTPLKNALQQPKASFLQDKTKHCDSGPHTETPSTFFTSRQLFLFILWQNRLNEHNESDGSGASLGRES